MEMFYIAIPSWNNFFLPKLTEWKMYTFQTSAEKF